MFVFFADDEEDARNSHLLFTLHVYQYRVDKATGQKSAVGSGAGGKYSVQNQSLLHSKNIS